MCEVPVLGQLSFYGLGLAGLAVGIVIGGGVVWASRALHLWWRGFQVGFTMAKPVMRMAGMGTVILLGLCFAGYLWIAGGL